MSTNYAYVPSTSEGLTVVADLFNVIVDWHDGGKVETYVMTKAEVEELRAALGPDTDAVLTIGSKVERSCVPVIQLSFGTLTITK